MERAVAERTLDWETIRLRLDPEAGGKSDPAARASEIARILKQRAEALAAPEADAAPTAAPALTLLVLSIAGQRYGIELDSVREVVPMRGITPVPGTPVHFPGVVNYRGDIVAVLDLRSLWSLSVPETGGERIVVVETEDMALGLIAETVLGVAQVGSDDLGPPPAASGHAQPTFVRAMTADMVAVLDLGEIARHPRVTVNTDVTRRTSS
jgi:purine-binding chemotaxis protein CheW